VNLDLGTWLHSCTKVREPMELSFEVVNGVGHITGVLKGPRAPKGMGLGGFCSPIALGRE